MFRLGIGAASPSKSLSTPAMIFSSVDLPEPFRPSTPILAPGKKLSEMSLRIWRFGGTILPRRFMVKTYCAMGCVTCCEGGRGLGSVETAGLEKGTRPDATRFERDTGPEVGS